LKVSTVLSGVVFGGSTAYAAWFWRAPRPIHVWAIFVIVTLAAFVAWWYLLRRSGYNTTTATVLYDVIVIAIWYAALIIWREATVTLAQTAGLLLVMIGSLIVAVTGD
jgi:hypothetical protein